MEKGLFAIEFGRTAIATRSDVDDETMLVYWAELSHWEDAEFTVAMASCRRELDRFPTLHQIRERRPLRPSKGQNTAEVYSSLVSVREIDSELGSDEMEAIIDNLSDAELQKLFIDSGVTSLQSANFSVQQFRRNPNGRLYRGYIRDELKHRQSGDPGCFGSFARPLPPGFAH